MTAETDCLRNQYATIAEVGSSRSKHSQIGNLLEPRIIPTIIGTEFPHTLLEHSETTKLTQELAVRLEQGRDLRQWHSMAN